MIPRGFKFILFDDFNKPIAKIKEKNPATLRDKALSILDKLQ